MKTFEKSGLDHFLAIFGCVLASFSVGMSVGKQQLAIVMASLLVLFGFIGYGLARLVRKSKLYMMDGWLFGLFAIAAIPLSLQVNNLLPEEGFPFSLGAAVIMWIVMLVGAIFAWRDMTLLFLSLPAIAIFGLVGTIDSWIPSVLLFCVFLICAAVLYARVHQRAMIEKAESLGEQRDLLTRGPWRWVAGPEWAFAAAGAVILLSVIIAPLVRLSSRPVAGMISRQTTNAITNAIQQRPRSILADVDTQIGQGPATVTETPVFKVKTSDDSVYLSGRAYAIYEGRGWSAAPQTAEFADYLQTGDTTFRLGDWLEQNIQSPDAMTKVHVEVKDVNQLSSTIFAPGIVVEASGLSVPGLIIDREGQTYVRGGQVSRAYQLETLVPNEIPIHAPMETTIGDPYGQIGNTPSSVRFATREATAEAKTPYEKAMKIKSYIERNVKYNLAAPVVPENVDAVEFFLFKSKEGYCDLFASAMALMAREAGIPARYVTGFLIDRSELPDRDGFYQVKSKHAHAWAELYFEGYGWIPFDPTEGAEQIAGNELGSSLSRFDKFWMTISSQVPTVLGIVVVVILLIVLYVNLIARKRIGRNPLISELIRQQNQFQKVIEKRVRHPRRFSQTAREYVRMHEAKLGTLGSDALAIVGALEAGMFSSETFTKEELSKIKRLVKQFSTKIKKLKHGVKERAKADPV